MKSEEEAKRWLRDAEACLNGAQKSVEAEDFRTTVQNGQLAVELSCKAVIASFSEPEWSHDPSDQLIEIMRVHREEIEKCFGKESIEKLKRVAEDVKEAAPWHGWSVYGRKRGRGWVSAVDLCGREKATRMLELAERSFKAAKEFIEKWF